MVGGGDVVENGQSNKKLNAASDFSTAVNINICSILWGKYCETKLDPKEQYTSLIFPSNCFCDSRNVWVKCYFTELFILPLKEKGEGKGREEKAFDFLKRMAIIFLTVL